MEGRNVDKRKEQTWDREGRERERTGDKERRRERKEEKGRERMVEKGI